MHVELLQSVGLAHPNGEPVPELLAVRGRPGDLSPDEGAVIRDATAFPEIEFVLFRRFADGRSSQPAAFVVDNSDERLSEGQLARLHGALWRQGIAPLVYVAWPTRVDILSCARGPDFWKGGDYTFSPVEQIHVASQVESELRKRRRFSAERLADGSFWDDPQNAPLAEHGRAAHGSLIQAIVEVDSELEGEQNPVLRRLLLLMVLIKYLEDRSVFPSGWFGRFCKGARSFFDVLKSGSPDDVLRLLKTLERRFNGDIFSLPIGAQQRLSRAALNRFAQLVEARTLEQQRYLWEQYSFEHLPVETISHLYQRFVHGHGTVYTPPFLASLLLDHAMPYDRMTGNERVLDPACGSGVFLVGAFRRLVALWRSKHGWKQPGVGALKSILTSCIYGVELDAGALDLAAFSLSLAVCDALKPNVIWNDLRFDPLRGTNLLQRDFFDCVLDRAEQSRTDSLGSFDVVVGNPPFESSLTDAGNRLNDAATPGRGKLPDRQTAYLFLEQGLSLLKREGRLCLIQPHGFLYNRKAFRFRQQILRQSRVSILFDFVSIRNLYDGADPKTVAVLASPEVPTQEDAITHLTFRRTYSARQRIGFEIDHYDRHRVPQPVAEREPLVWRINLLGGGRLHELSSRLGEMRTLADFIEEQQWASGEGFIVGKRTQPGPHLTGKPLLPTSALTPDGIDESRLEELTETRFQWPREEVLFRSPLVLIREHESLPSAFWDKGAITYKHEIVGIRAPDTQRAELRRFFDTFRRRLRLYQFCCAVNGSQALVGKATAILKGDIESLPYPGADEELDFTYWERALQDDVLEYLTEFIRLGQNSDLLRRAAEASDLDAYGEMFCSLLGSIHEELQAASPVFLVGLICQPFYFGKAPEVDWLGPDCERELLKLVYGSCLETLRTVRVVRLYHENVIFILKPDRLRYWIRSTAIRDADETLVELHQQGY